MFFCNKNQVNQYLKCCWNFEKNNYFVARRRLACGGAVLLFLICRGFGATTCCTKNKQTHKKHFQNRKNIKKCKNGIKSKSQKVKIAILTFCIFFWFFNTFLKIKIKNILHIFYCNFLYWQWRFCILYFCFVKVGMCVIGVVKKLTRFLTWLEGRCWRRTCLFQAYKSKKRNEVVLHFLTDES